MNHPSPAASELTRRHILFVGAATALAACSSDPSTPADASAIPDASSDTPTADTAADVAPADNAPVDVAPADVPPADVPPADVSPADVPPADVPPADVPAVCPPAGATMLGALSAFPVGSWRNVKAASVIVGRDARGIFAYTSVCTHSGCTVPAPGSAMAISTCPCHGSRYNAEGMVVGGPAPDSLVNYEVVVCGGNVFLNMARMVPMGTRTAVA